MLQCLQALEELAPVLGTLCVRITVAGTDGTVTNLEVSNELTTILSHEPLVYACLNNNQI